MKSTIKIYIVTVKAIDVDEVYVYRSKDEAEVKQLELFEKYGPFTMVEVKEDHV